MMKHYKEFQFGWVIFFIAVPVQTLLTILYVYEIGDNPLDLNGFILVNTLSLFIYLLFYGMKTKVDPGTIIVSFGIGLIKKRITINRIKELKPVKNPVIYGRGIRIIPNGMLFNISGSDALELTFLNTPRIIRIGTKDPENLKKEITKAMGA